MSQPAPGVPGREDGPVRPPAGSPRISARDLFALVAIGSGGGLTAAGIALLAGWQAGLVAIGALLLILGVLVGKN